MANLLQEDMCSYQVYDNYITTNDFKVQAKLKSTTRRQRDSNKIIPEIVQQREKERELKKILKREKTAIKKDTDIKRTQSRIASGRRQLLFNKEYNEIENDNELAVKLNQDIFLQMMLYDWYYSVL